MVQGQGAKSGCRLAAQDSTQARGQPRRDRGTSCTGSNGPGPTPFFPSSCSLLLGAGRSADVSACCLMGPRGGQARGGSGPGPPASSMKPGAGMGGGQGCPPGRRQCPAASPTPRPGGGASQFSKIDKTPKHKFQNQEFQTPATLNMEKITPILIMLQMFSANNEEES